MSPAACERVKKDRDARRLRLGPQVETQPITREHFLYRGIIDKHVDFELGKPRPSAFTDPGMSVFVEGPGFSKINWDKVMQNRNWIGIVKIDAAEFLDNQTFYNFELLHDPYADDKGNQHDNHGLVICGKNVTKATKIQQVCTWEIQPHEHG